ncbi:MAG TPA: GGDEF domain-containing protein [Burkholderiales bacterium]|nr:GGDEF domain-containing protein [Burkholderiales bacterium]
MALDTRSLLAALFLSYVLLGALSIAFARLNPHARAIRAWGGALLVFAAGFATGFAGFALGSRLPAFVSITVANAFGATGAYLTLRCARVFRGVEPRDRIGLVLLAAAIVALAWFDVVHPDLAARTAILSLITAALVLRAGRTIGSARAGGPAQTLLAGLLFVVAALMAIHGSSVLLTGMPGGYLAPSAYYSFLLLAYLAAGIAGTTAVLLAEIELLTRGLERVAKVDMLTEIPNRRGLLAEFERELSRAQRAAAPLALALMDLDHFKRINDEFGHPAGDAMLREVVKRILATVREHDIVGRFGGEEFALIVPGGDREAAAWTAERVREAVAEQPFDVDGRRMQTTLSAGVAVLGEDGADWDTLIEAADRALYEAKRRGRDRVVPRAPLR